MVSCGRDNILNARDTIIAEKRRCLYLAAALAIVEEQQKRLEEARKGNPTSKKDTKESVGQGMVDQKARVWTV